MVSRCGGARKEGTARTPARLSHRDRSARCARPRPRQGGHPPRRQARQHLPASHRRWRDGHQAPRLRHLVAPRREHPRNGRAVSSARCATQHQSSSVAKGRRRRSTCTRPAWCSTRSSQDVVHSTRSLTPSGRRTRICTSLLRCCRASFPWRPSWKPSSWRRSPRSRRAPPRRVFVRRQPAKAEAHPVRRASARVDRGLSNGRGAHGARIDALGGGEGAVIGRSLRHFARARSSVHRPRRASRRRRSEGVPRRPSAPPRGSGSELADGHDTRRD